MLFYIKQMELFSINGPPKRAGAPRLQVRGGLDPTLFVLVMLALISATF